MRTRARMIKRSLHYRRHQLVRPRPRPWPHLRSHPGPSHRRRRSAAQADPPRRVGGAASRPQAYALPAPDACSQGARCAAPPARRCHLHQFVLEPVVASAPDQTTCRERANESEALTVERPTDGDEKATPVHTQTAQPNVVATLSSGEPVGEQNREKKGSENCPATTAQTCSNLNGDGVATKDASAEEPSTTLAAADPDQVTTTNKSQQPNSAEAEESASLEAPVEGMKKSRSGPDFNGADRERDKTTNGQPDEGHTGPRDDADAQNNDESNVEQPDYHTSDAEENDTVPSTEADAEGSPGGERDGDATENFGVETTGDDTTANAEDNTGVTAETVDDDGSNANAEDDANTKADEDANANANLTSDG
ncbi:hypothetical protein FGB62_241g07 [Gracilaria domingensis]|nr:hypothetical protein FGB62_241g07 [Gracilaria domingensis]